MQARRVDQFVGELGFDRVRLIGWAIAQSVLAAWWSFEDNDENWKLFIEWADLLSELK